MFVTEDTIHKAFKVLPASLVTKLLETFSSQFWRNRKTVTPLKACELGSELSWLPRLCVQKGVQYEGYTHTPALASKIRADLLESKVLYFRMPLVSDTVKVVPLNCDCRAGSTTSCWAAGPFGRGSQPIVSNSA